MPDDQTYHLVGDLRSGAFFVELHTPDGAVWELDRNEETLQFLGQRVEVVGVRIGFNDLRYEQIWPAGQERPAPRKADPLVRNVVITVSALVLLIFILRLT
jgi:Protein of unknown function (DUF5818)